MKWAALTAASLVLGWLAQWAHIPAPWLVASMLAAIVAAVFGIGLQLPRIALTVPQGVIGLTIGQVFTMPILVEIAQQWLPLLLVVAATILSAGIAGWLLARFSPLSPQTAAWGSAPGASVTMIALSAENGGDPRIVAFMQYLRVTVVVMSAALVTHLLNLTSSAPTGHTFAATSPFALVPFAITIALAIGSSFAGRYSGLPGAQFLAPFLLGAVIHVTGILPIDITWWLLALAYVTTGWTIGLQYTRELLQFVAKLLPTLILSTGVLLALCAVSGVLLVLLVKTDPLTAYLATTPGGLDSVSLIALGSSSNVAFVLAIQMLRLLAVVICGPPMAKTIARFA
jgi:membrane AbrB-like protein